MKRQLFEIDTRFGQLGDRGIFRSLERAGVLTHHIAGVDNLEHAVNHPPAVGRARLRGETVRQLCRSGGGHMCDWQSVWDGTQQRLLDLSDPFSAGALWQGSPSCNPPDDRGVIQSLLRMAPRLRCSSGGRGCRWLLGSPASERPTFSMPLLAVSLITGQRCVLFQFTWGF